MPQIDEHLKWCLKDPKRLVKTKPDLDLAQKHVIKNEKIKKEVKPFVIYNLKMR